MIKSTPPDNCCRPATKHRKAPYSTWIYALTLMLTAGCAVYAYTQYQQNRSPVRKECVILLHGLLRSAASMTLIKHHLIHEGYDVINIDYASTRKSIPAIAEDELASAVEKARSEGYEQIHFVSHSLGALVIRAYLQDHQMPEGSRIVMLAPPNQGSELADWAYASFPRLIRIAGPAANALGTQKQAYTTSLRPIDGEIGIIIGDDSWNPLFSKILPGRDDGAVTVERSKLQEMQDFMVAPCNHTTIILDRKVLSQVVCFLQTGYFANPK